MSTILRVVVALVITAIAVIANADKKSTYESHPAFSATYTVPTSQELAAFATWRLKDLKFVRNNEFISATYKMPADLFDETAQDISMTGTIKNEDGFFTMNGDNVQASCSMSGKDSYVCLLKFKKSNLKLRTNDEYFKHLYASNVEIHNRMTVVETFSGDPVGILKIDKR